MRSVGTHVWRNANVHTDCFATTTGSCPVIPARGQDRPDDHRQRGDEAPGPAPQERDRVDAPRAVDLGEQQRRDEEPAQREEDVDAHHPAGVIPPHPAERRARQASSDGQRRAQSAVTKS
jgi:hypothetical protein